MRSDAGLVAEQVDVLVSRIQQIPEVSQSPEEKIIVWLNDDYPGDVGIFSVFFLNYVEINEPNRFIFCAADEPHAYLVGDCVECMALSDNVVRAGLTPKFKDVDTLLSMMSYRDNLLEFLVNVGERICPNVVKYNPPVDDFMVYEVEGGKSGSPLPLPHASICLCVSGSFTLDLSSQLEDVSKGSILFCRAGTVLNVVKSAVGAQLFIATY